MGERRVVVRICVSTSVSGLAEGEEGGSLGVLRDVTEAEPGIHLVGWAGHA